MKKNSFNLSNSLVVGYNQLVNKGGGPAGLGDPADPSKLKLGENVTIQKEGGLEIVKDPTSKYYLHLAPGTLGSELGAGLFLPKEVNSNYELQETHTFEPVFKMYGVQAQTIQFEG
ncbi:hypothetical protein [Algoriphagus boritolerans]|uniref:hypothetical protein n=1 Tax=Algoriphagus boritolerans TaxID=308111 RepID=UPI000B1FF67D